MIKMAEATVVRNTPALGALRSELTRDPIDGYRARHDCPDGGQWIGAARATEFEAMADAASHEHACGHRRHHVGVQTAHPGQTFERRNGRRGTDLPKGGAMRIARRPMIGFVIIGASLVLGGCAESAETNVNAVRAKLWATKGITANPNAGSYGNGLGVYAPCMWEEGLKCE